MNGEIAPSLGLDLYRPTAVKVYWMSVRIVKWLVVAGSGSSSSGNKRVVVQETTPTPFPSVANADSRRPSNGLTERLDRFGDVQRRTRQIISIEFEINVKRGAEFGGSVGQLAIGTWAPSASHVLDTHQRLDPTNENRCRTASGLSHRV